MSVQQMEDRIEKEVCGHQETLIKLPNKLMNKQTNACQYTTNKDVQKRGKTIKNGWTGHILVLQG
jgi:hypothetical protein